MVTIVPFQGEHRMWDWYQLFVWFFVVSAAVWLDIKFIKYLQVNKDRLVPVRIFGRRSNLLSAIYTMSLSLPKYRPKLPFIIVVDGVAKFYPLDVLKNKSITTDKTRLNTLTSVLSVVLICAWALWVGRDYLDFNPASFPNGGDIPLQIYGHFGWYPLTQCGTCVFWNGYINGGQPTFAEVQGATLHPFTIITTSLFGAINSAKLISLASLFIAGIAQWWLARTMGLGKLASLWAAAVVIVGGHLSDRAGRGMININFATASASLILPSLVNLLQNPRMRTAVLVGVFTGLTLLAGQAYVQIAVLFGLFPALILYIYPSYHSQIKLRTYLIFSLGLAVLLSAVLWLPVLHFLPSFSKYGDPYLASAQPIDAVPLLLILRQETSLYIGWIPILLAFLSLHLVPPEKKKLMWFFFLAIFFIFMISSSTFLQFLMKHFSQISILRFPDSIMTLAVPLVIALAAWALDYLLKSPMYITLKSQTADFVNIRFVWILFPLVLLLTLPTAYKFSRWRYDTHLVERPDAVQQWLKTDFSEWIHIPNPDFDWVPIAMDRGYKITNVYRPWYWKDKTPPGAYLEATTDQIENSDEQIEYLYLLRNEDNRYAAVHTPDGGFFPCQARANGGHIDVSCINDRPGTLVVMENYYSGWTARVDEKSTSLYKDDWLKVAAPAGEHSYAFRYRPWDVWVGMALTLFGIGIAVYTWRRDRV
jgi:hypothetical protein